MKKDVFIDGETGTTGLQVHEKLSKHPNVNIMSVDQSKRKDISYKKEMLAKDLLNGYKFYDNSIVY